MPRQGSDRATGIGVLGKDEIVEAVTCQNRPALESLDEHPPRQLGTFHGGTFLWGRRVEE